MSAKYDRLKALLLELFQLDKPDLDFGIYRIMHARAAEVTKFLEDDLLPQVKDALAGYESGNRNQIEESLAEAIASAKDLGVNPKESTKVRQLEADLQATGDIDRVEGEVYDLIIRFFSRYYNEGDFISQRRYSGENTYAIPYNGEEVLLHWANKDQYYIKTSEYLNRYSFLLNPDDDANPMRVTFRLIDADEGEHGNIKSAADKGRVFVLTPGGESGQDFAEIIDGELVIDFEFRPTTMADWPVGVKAGKKPPKQKDITAGSVAAISSLDDDVLASWIDALSVRYRRADGSESERTKLEVHLDRYAKKNTFDYFIHKDLGGFLRRELDFFIKNEVMHLDDIENTEAVAVETYLGKLRAVRRVAGKIIEFLAQLEDFQKKLWLKKKFVVGTSYLVTIGNIDESFYAEICANETQREEWVDLFKIDQQERDLLTVDYTEPLTPEFLVANPTMTLNTDLFDDAFTAEILEYLSDQGLEGQIDQIMWNGDNSDALALMGERYACSIAATYIDPPYNTGDDGFPYKDSYQHSSWLSMMSDRLALGQRLQTGTGALAVSIDDAEQHRLTELLQSTLGDNELAKLVWDRNRKNDARYFSVGHEYMLVWARSMSTLTSEGVKFRESKEGIDDARLVFDRLRAEHGDDWNAIGAGWRRWFDDIPVSDPRRRLRRYAKVSERGPFRDDGNPSWPGGGGPRYEVLHPLTGKPCKIPSRGWVWGSPERFWEVHEEGGISFGADETTIPSSNTFLFESDDQVMPSVFYSYAQSASQEFNAIFGYRAFDNPKNWKDIARVVRYLSGEDDIVLDYFAGSGSTGHAAISMCHATGERRQTLLVEIGSHFDRVMLPRIRKVAFTPSWADGCPSRRPNPLESSRSPRVMKVLRLESYEDVLNNLALNRSSDQQSLLDSAGVEFREQYMLRYQLDVEAEGSKSLLTVDAFDEPMNYELMIKHPGSDESRPTRVDLIETFSYLIGLTVEGITAPRTFVVETSRDGRGRLQVNRFKQDADGTHWFRTVTGTSPDGDRVLVIWRNRPGGNITDLDAIANIEIDNAVLNHWFGEQHQYSVKESKFDLIYVNGDNNLGNMRKPDEQWTVLRIDDEFHRLMFDSTGMP